MAAQGEIHGKPIIALFVCDTGPIKEAEKRVGSIKAFGSPVGDVIQRRTYVSQQSLLDATQPKGRRYYWKSEYLPKLEAGLLAKTIEHAERIVSPHSVILLFPLDGALNGLPESHSPMGIAMQRRSSTSRPRGKMPRTIRRTSSGRARLGATCAASRPAGAYVNFLIEEEGERIRAAYGKNHDRLVGVKTKWDPGNLFRTNKNIEPQVS